MEYRRLGKSGLLLSELSLGSWVTFGHQVGENIAEDCMKLAYDNGVNFFDNAEAYASGKSEEVMGKVLKKMGWDRTSYVVSTKVFWGGKLPNQIGLSKKHIIEACNNSLKRMQQEYVDLFFCHRPDKNTPIEETVRAMQTLLDQGKILYWGTSEWSAQEIMEAYSVARQYGLTPPTMEQPQYNMFNRYRVEVEYSKLYSEIGLGTTIWSPLASGLLSNRHFSGIAKDSRLELPNMEWLKERFMSDEGQANLLKAKKLNAVALELGISLPQLAIVWCLRNKNVSTVMLGASKLEQLKETIKSNEYQQVITPEMDKKLEEILSNKPLIPQF
jgi:voltage-dependent potassium channel beta subunit